MKKSSNATFATFYLAKHCCWLNKTSRRWGGKSKADIHSKLDLTTGCKERQALRAIILLRLHLLSYSTDCAICSDGYAQSLAFKCNKCSGNRDIIFAALILPLAVALMGTFVAFLVSKEQECTGRGRFDRLKELLPLESIRIVIVAWQILLSVRVN